MAVVIVACAAVVATGLSGAVSPVQGLQFAQAGHWVASPEVRTVFHINGGANGVDAQVSIPGLVPGSQVVQGPTDGYVIGGQRIIQFGKSDLQVRKRTMVAPANERPAALEVAGGPYLVYRNAGQVVRLGDDPQTISAGGPLGDPVATTDGTLWVHRTDSGALCRLGRDATALDCPATAPGGHPGALSVIGERAAFVDTQASTISPLTADGLGDAVPLRIRTTPASEIAAHDVNGKLAVYDGHSRLHLVDAGGPDLRARNNAVTVNLPDDDYSGPASSGGSVVLLDRKKKSVLTYSPDGKPGRVTPMPAESGEPQLTSGEDRRVYVDGAEGRHVLVVDHDGSVSDVPVVGARSQENGRKPGGPDSGDHVPVDAPTPPDVLPQPVPPQVPTGEPEQKQRPKPKPKPKRDPLPDRQPAPKPRPEQPDPAPRQQPDPEPQQPTQQTPTPHHPKPTPKPKPKPKPQKPVTASKPGMPTITLAAIDSVKGNGFVSWNAAAANGSPITSYRVTYQQVGGSAHGGVGTAGTSTSTILTGIPYATQYQVSVTATNAAGAGPTATSYALVDSDDSDDGSGDSGGDDCDDDDDDCGDGFRATPSAYHPMVLEAGAEQITLRIPRRSGRALLAAA